MGRTWSKKLVVPVALPAAALLALAGCSDSGSGNEGRTGNGSIAESRSPDVPAPTGPERTGPAPASVPSVRDWDPVRGPGWRPTRDTRVVADPHGPLADEAKLLAAELKVPRSAGPARTADVALTVDRGARTGREGYVLRSDRGRITITGATDAGVFYGTRTLLQAVRAQGSVADGVVHDRPDRSQRGLSVDISRKHFSASWIEDRIRELGDLKLNQLQLHLSDDQAFRLESSTHPEIVAPQHLTKAQVRHLVAVAASRHVAVIPEFDSPGHTGAILAAHPDLQLRNAAGRRIPGAMDISQPAAARLLDDLLHEYRDLFPGRHWHLGGDEYQALLAEDPDASYPGLAARARRLFGSDAGVRDLTTDWLNDRAATLRKEGKIPEVWNDGVLPDGVVRPKHDRQLGYWTGREDDVRSPESYLRDGWKLVNLNDEFLYYVLGQPNNFTYPTGKRIYEDWSPAVLRGTRPVPASLSGPDRVLGGRFAVWCDLADAQTPDQVARGIRMPLAATAQKLWDDGRPGRSWDGFRRLVDRVE